MRKNRIQKVLRALAAVILLLASVPAAVFAVNDAADLGYRLQITVTDKNGMPADTFQVGDTVHVKLSLAYTGAGKAPVYGLQGQLRYDPYVINNTRLSEKNGVNSKELGGLINFVFLDLAAQGKSDAMLSNIGEAVFVAKNNGTVTLYGENFILTNRDASGRYVGLSGAVTITVGTGVKDVTKEALEADITAAKQMLADCTVSDLANPGIYYPNFWVTTKTAQALEAAIRHATAVLFQFDATREEIETETSLLNDAVKLFLESRIFGPERWVGDVLVKVTASIRGGNGRILPGSVTQECSLNTSCTIRVQPEEGYETEYVYVNGERFTGSDSFTIPSVKRDTTVVVTFCRKPPFTDISSADWFYISARYAYHNGILKGTSETEFSPLAPVTRAMLATVLHRMEGQPETSLSEPFSDVPGGLWYTEAIGWAKENQIVNGHGDGRFAPDGPITREQIAVMLYRYAGWKSAVSEPAGTELRYADAAEISDYALQAVIWAVETGLIKGNTETTINPQGIATRAEMATLLQRFSELLG